MQLKHLIDDTNRELYNSISQHLPIQLSKSNENNWTSVMEEKRIKIGHAPITNPKAAFAHELLHIDTQLNGYRKLRSGLSLHPMVRFQIPDLCYAIDNEFQHHKMYPKFIAMGYQPHEFYDDQDALNEQRVRYGIEAKGQSLLSLSNSYLTLIAPGGSIPQQNISDLREQFRQYDDGAFRASFDLIDRIIEEWKSDTLYNAEPYVKQYMNIIGCTDTWISYGNQLEGFPGEGFFINRVFTI